MTSLDWVKEGELLRVTLLVRAVRQDESGGLYYQRVNGGYIAYLRPQLIKGIKKVRRERKFPGVRRRSRTSAATTQD